VKPSFVDAFVTIQQQSTMRHLNAHLSPGHDYGLYTAVPHIGVPVWKIIPEKSYFRIIYAYTGKSVDVHDLNDSGYGCVLRDTSTVNSQLWDIDINADNECAFQQVGTTRLMAADDLAENNHAVFACDSAAATQPRWVVKNLCEVFAAKNLSRFLNKHRSKKPALVSRF